jgi:hypothetical protein
MCIMLILEKLINIYKINISEMRTIEEVMLL